MTIVILVRRRVSCCIAVEITRFAHMPPSSNPRSSAAANSPAPAIVRPSPRAAPREEIPSEARARIAALGLGAAFMSSTLVTPLYALYRDAFGFSEVTLTLVYATYVLGNLAALLCFGRLSDQLGRRRVGMPALGLAAVAMGVFLAAQGTPWLFAGRLLSGLALGIVTGTMTAWIAELMPGADKARASALATAFNMAGLALGPLVAGALVQWAPQPLRTPFIVYLAALAATGVAVARLPETVQARGREPVSLAPKLGVPQSIRAQFWPPAIAAFANFSYGGFYAALLPGLLANDLGLDSPLLAGAIVCECYGLGALVVLATMGLRSRTGILWGLALLVPGVGGLLLAKAVGSLAVLVAASAIGGLGFGLCYRGTLQAVNAMAPADRRAAVVSSFMLACFLGNSLPVIGVGVLSAWSDATSAQTVFAATVVLLAVFALVGTWRLLPREE
jgi:predicted MFS family arabinose efflux permease